MLDQLASHYKKRLLQTVEFAKPQSLARDEIRSTIRQLIERFIQEEKVILPRADQEELINRVLDDSVGLGPLELFLHDDEISEIMVNGPSEIYIERNGMLQKTDARFRDEAHVRHIIDRIVAPVGRRVDESSPMADARLIDGSRVHVVIPPVSLNGPILTIRKFRKEPLTMDDLLGKDSLDERMAEFLRLAVRAKMNILVSGGTGSGKTTLLNVLSSFIPERERIVTIEDSAELQLQGKHVIGLETRSLNVEGRGEISIRELLRNSLRMRPDRIIVGEVRGGEAFDMLQAMNTGHKGSLTTIHANSSADALIRLESMVLFAGVNLPVAAIRQYIASSLDLIIQTERMKDGKRRIVSISEVQKDGDGIIVQEIFGWQQLAVNRMGEVCGEFRISRHLPACLAQIRLCGEAPERFWEGQECSV